MAKKRGKGVLLGIQVVGFVAFCAVIAGGQPLFTQEIPLLNALTDEEAAAGWQSLFNGRDLLGWRTPEANQGNSPGLSGWGIRDSAITSLTGSEQAIVSRETFDNFELSLEWSVGTGGDGGVFLRVWKDDVNLRHISPQVQIIDNDANKFGADPNTWAGACAYLYPPSEDMTRPVGLFNHLKVLMVGGHVEHWLNGAKVVEYQIGNEDWKARLGKSMYKAYPDLGSGTRGYIGLQQLMASDRYRNIKIRALDPSTSIRFQSVRRPPPTGGAAARFDTQGRLLKGLQETALIRWAAVPAARQPSGSGLDPAYFLSRAKD